jgi:ATP-binding cassette, subfamily B, bacterial
MILVRAKREAPSSLKEMGRSLAAVWNLRGPQPTGRPPLRGVAAFPRRPIPFLWHYVRRRPLLHFTALAAVLGAATCAFAAQYGLKLIVDALAQGAEHMTAVWLALAVFVGLLGGESTLWRFGSWLGYRAMLADKAEARLDLFDHLGGHSSRYFTDVMSGSLASRVSSTGDPVQQVLSIVLFNIAPVCADFCAALAILATVEWHLVTALALSFVLLAVGTLAVLGQRGTPRHRTYADRAAEVGDALVDVVSNIWAIKAFSAHSRERRGFAQLLQTETTAHRDSLMYIERMRVLHDLGLWLMASAMLIWSLSLWKQGRIRPGDVILTVAVAFRILHGSRDLAFAAVNATQFVSRIADAIQVIGEDHKVVDGPGARQLLRPGGSIAFENVDFSYPSGRRCFAASACGSNGATMSVWSVHPAPASRP